MRERLLGVAAVLLPAFAWAGEMSGDMTRYRFATPVALSGLGASSAELAEVVLPAEASLAVRDDLADIRVVRADSGELVPCLVDYARDEVRRTVRRSVGLRLARAEELEGGRLRVLLEREDRDPKARPLNGIVIHTPLRDFERRVTVELSSDGEKWELAAEDVRILDLSSHADFRANEIGLPPLSGQRFLRLTVDRMDEVRVSGGRSVTTSADGGGKVRSIERSILESVLPFRVDRVDGWTEETEWVRDAHRLTDRELRVSAGEPAELRRRFPEARLLCVESGRVPLERLLTRSAKTILSLTYQLFAKTDEAQTEGPEWRWVGAGKLSRILFRDYRQEQMEMVFPVTHADGYCLVLADAAGASDLEVVRGQGPFCHVIFPCAPGQRYQVLAGNPDVSGPAGYQAEQIRTLMRKYRPVDARLEGWRENPSWLKSREGAFAGEAAWALPAAVVLAIVVLGAAVAFALKRMPEHSP